MIRFDSDYNEGAHPRILESLVRANLEQMAPYGEDRCCSAAAGLIRDLCGRQDLGVHFLTGGTQTNLTFISSALRPYQGVIAAVSGHINTHEGGAIEATGHKILAQESADGKLTAEQIQKVFDGHMDDEAREQMVQPKLVYLSNPTELGTIYRKAELTAIAHVCRKKNLLLYLDGARLGYALRAEGGDVGLSDLAGLCDAFYIGGTKVGALFGEALVICRNDLNENFRYALKQRGAMLAKGWLLGLQFRTLFEDGLYFDIAARANKTARQIKEACLKKGYHPLFPSVTNQQFFIMPDTVLRELDKKYLFSFWGKIDGKTSAVRICTGWATGEGALRDLIRDIEAF